MDKPADDTAFARRHRTRGGGAGIVMAVSLVLLAGFSALVVDYAYLHHRKGVLRRAVESGAMAGMGLLVGLGRDIAQVRDAVIRAAQRNLGRDDCPDLAVRDSDVAFLRQGHGTDVRPDQIQVAAGRTQARGNPVRLFLGGLWGQSHVDVSVLARAALYCVKSSEGLAPFVIPAGYSWNDRCDPDPRFNGNGILDVSSPCEKASVRVSGYGGQDVGRRIVLVPARPGEVAPGAAFPVKGNLREADGGRWTAAGTPWPHYRAGLGERLDVGFAFPHARWLEDQARLRMDQDPDAFWDESLLAVKGSCYQDPDQSPRMARVAFFDPTGAPCPERPQASVVQLGAVFIETLFEDGGVTVRLARAMAVAPVRDASACDPQAVGLYGAALLPSLADGDMN